LVTYGRFAWKAPTEACPGKTTRTQVSQGPRKAKIKIGLKEVKATELDTNKEVPNETNYIWG
jgi:hypothetical protein